MVADIANLAGEARPLAKREGISNIKWSRDGKFIYFTGPPVGEGGRGC